MSIQTLPAAGTAVFSMPEERAELNTRCVRDAAAKALLVYVGRPPRHGRKI